MVAPAISSTATELWNSTGPWARADGEETGWALMKLAEAISQPLDYVEQLVRDDANGPGWSKVLDADRVPIEGTGYLGQMVGVAIPPSLTLDQQRTYIKALTGFSRGRVDALQALVQMFLSGTKRVDVTERTTDAYHLKVVTYTSETPFVTYDETDTHYPTYTLLAAAYPTYNSIPNAEADIRAALGAAKPGGLVLTYEVHADWTYDQARAAYPTYALLNAAFATYNDLDTHVPGS